MPRKYIRKTGARKYGYSETDLASAINDVNEGRLSITKAAIKYKIAKGTLMNKLKDKHTKKAGRPVIFSENEEMIFVQHITEVAKWGFPFTTVDLRQLAKMYLDKSGRHIKVFKNNLPSVEWAWRFLQRHKQNLSNKMCQNLIRTKAAVTPVDMMKYFNHLKNTMCETLTSGETLNVPPERIFNYDETNLADDLGLKKCIFKRGVKYAERVQHYSKAAISVMYCGSAAGVILPPYVVYKSSHLWQTWMENGPHKTRYNRSLSGWFDSVYFTDWFENLFLPETKKLGGKIVLLGDNLSSHFSPIVIELAQSNNVTFVCLPPNSTHIAQPLDVAFFAPFKRNWRRILDNWKTSQKKSSQILSKEVFPSLLKMLHNKLVDENNISQNIISGFKKCGIFPFEPNEVISRLPQVSQQNLEPAASFVSAVIEMLSKSRNETPEKPNRKRRKVKVSPGKGITIEALRAAVNESVVETSNAIQILDETIFEPIPSTSGTKKPNAIKPKTKKKNKKVLLQISSTDEETSMSSTDIPFADSSNDCDWNLSDEELLQLANIKP